MAKSEHQGLQIAMILFAMVSVVLAITTFLFYRSADEQGKLAAAAEKAKQDATTRANDSDARLEYALHILGISKLPQSQVDQLQQSFAADEKMKGVVSNYQQHMTTYASGLPKEELTYADVLPKMLTTMRQVNIASLNQLADATKSKEERDGIQKSETARTSEAIQKLDQTLKTLDDERTKFQADRTTLQGQQETQLGDFSKKLKEKDNLVTVALTKEEDAYKKVKELTQTVDTQKKTIIDMRDEPFEVADGQITWVNQSAKMAWINLGLADGLRRQTLFSVYDQSDNGVKRTNRKASIEVTRVLSQHLAEARIVSDIPADPILPGDVIFSPAWRPGKRIHFALAGFLDIDGDHRSDRNLVRSLLVASGGHIDFEMFDDGSTEGEMSSSTRYLVLGETPTDRSDPKVLASWSKANGEAQQLGVEIINVDKMLEWVGYRPEVRSVGLGANADPLQFKNKAQGNRPTAVGGPATKFRERKPVDMESKNRSTFQP